VSVAWFARTIKKHVIRWAIVGFSVPLFWGAMSFIFVLNAILYAIIAFLILSALPERRKRE
jgi:hypothetical protein